MDRFHRLKLSVGQSKSCILISNHVTRTRQLLTQVEAKKISVFYTDFHIRYCWQRYMINHVPGVFFVAFKFDLMKSLNSVMKLCGSYLMCNRDFVRASYYGPILKFDDVELYCVSLNCTRCYGHRPKLGGVLKKTFSFCSKGLIFNVLKQFHHFILSRVELY